MTIVGPALLLLMGAVLAPPGVDAVTSGPAAGRTDSAREGVPRVAILPDRPQLPLGDGESLALQVDVLGVPPGTPLALRALASVGRVEAPTPTGTWGRFVSRYLPPPTRFPQVAIIAVDASFGDQHARGVLRVPMPAATEIPFRTDPHARVTLRVGDRTFGPVSADGAGKVKIPIVVPPGVAIGQARAINLDGNLNETIVDLQPTPYPRALIVTPAHVVAGGMAELAIYGVEPNGDATPSNRLNLHASQGLVHAVDAIVPGEVRFLYETPTTADLITLDVTRTGDPGGSARLEIPVEAGPPLKLTLTPSTSWLVIGSGASARIGVAAQDRFGNSVPCQGATLLSGETSIPVDIAARTGEASALVAAPERYQGKDTLVVEARLGEVRATTEILLSGGPPARLTAVLATPSVVADGQHGVDVLVNAVDANGTPTLVSGLSWDLPGGHLDNVRKPRVGSYLAEFVPRRASEPHTEILAVMAGQNLRADVVVRVEPPHPRAVATARVAFFSNLGSSSGPAAFVDVVRPLHGRARAVSLGVRVGYLHDDLTAQPPPGQPAPGARVEINQFPLLAIARYRLAVTAADISVGAGVGLSLGRIRLTPPVVSGAPPADSNGRALAVEVGGEAAFKLAPGRLVVGLRFLRIEFGHTTQNDEIRGNSAGLVADLGYRLSY